jgi:hypothetical protein
MHTTDEREDMLAQMRAASNLFYVMATRAGCHPFIEFAGLMNEYIQVCERAHKLGVDFAMCNKHTGENLPLKPYEVAYIQEKLECIFTGRLFVSEQPSQPLPPSPAEPCGG